MEPSDLPPSPSEPPKPPVPVAPPEVSNASRPVPSDALQPMHLLPPLAVVLLLVDGVFVTAWSGVLAVLGALLLLEPLFVSERAALPTLATFRRLPAALGTLSRLKRYLLFLFGIFFILRLIVLIYDLSGHPEVDDGLVVATRLYDFALVLLGLSVGVIQNEMRQLGRLAVFLANRPTVLLVSSFLVIIAVGSSLLMLPLAVTDAAHLSFVDALFTATSAVSVTGHAVNDVSSVYTTFGHVVVIVCCQLGGLGIMTIAALAATIGRGSLEQHAGFSAALEARSLADLRSLVRTVVIYTVAIELVGALVLWVHWQDAPWLGDRNPLWLALFHSIAAFCNAGFSLFPDSMMRFSGDAVTQVVIMLLILTGGIGFVVMREVGWRVKRLILNRFRRRKIPWRRVGVGVRVALFMTIALVVIGALGVGAAESQGVLSGMSPGDQFMNALFASVTARSAGFNTVDIAALSHPTLLILIMLMFIGGSPGSTAGGIKTNTLAVVLATLRGELRGREPELFGRAIDPRSVRRAVAVLTSAGFFAAFITLALVITEPDKPFLSLLFDTISALGTVGLSVGVTYDLSTAGKVVMTFAMFVGRVGPLTIAYAVGRDRAHTRHRLATEEIAVG